MSKQSNNMSTMNGVPPAMRISYSWSVEKCLDGVRRYHVYVIATRPDALPTVVSEATLSGPSLDAVRPLVEGISQMLASQPAELIVPR